MQIHTTTFGKDHQGIPVLRHELTNRHGSSVTILEFGASIQSVMVPDKSGLLGDIVLGFDSVSGYEKQKSYIGGVVGRYAGRIADGRFEVGGVEYQVARNNPPNHLHGGSSGFDKRVWKTVSLSEDEGSATVVLALVSEDRDQGYPGRLAVQVNYTFDDSNTLSVSYEAYTDKKTIINLTQHAYFNLNGHDADSIAEHELAVAASEFLPIEKTYIPTGERRAVAGTPFDFLESRPLAEVLASDDRQIEIGRGIDHTFVLNTDGFSATQKLAASMYSRRSGRTLQVTTDQPGIHVYTGNFLDGSERGKAGVAYKQQQGVCLETQHFSNSPNVRAFPSTLLNVGDDYRSSTCFFFGVESELYNDEPTYKPVSQKQDRRVLTPMI